MDTVERKLRVLQWMVGINVVLTVILIGTRIF